MSMPEEFMEMPEMSTAVISDALSRMGLKHQTMHSAIKPLSSDMRPAGPSPTAECCPAAPMVRKS